MPEISAVTFVVVAVLANFVWRFGGVVIAGHVEEASRFFAWTTCVSYAIAAGLMMNLLVLPSGALSATAFADRSIAFAAAVVVFYLAKRRLFLGLAVGIVLFFVLITVRNAT